MLGCRIEAWILKSVGVDEGSRMTPLGYKEVLVMSTSPRPNRRGLEKGD